VRTCELLGPALDDEATSDFIVDPARHHVKQFLGRDLFLLSVGAEAAVGVPVPGELILTRVLTGNGASTEAVQAGRSQWEDQNNRDQAKRSHPQNGQCESDLGKSQLGIEYRPFTTNSE